MIWSDRGSDVASAGLEAARTRSRQADAAVLAWAKEAFQGRCDGIAIIALGGYGREELLPASDLDLLLFTDDPAAREGEIERFFAGLWDRGHTVGHAVRTPGDLKKIAAGHIESRTTLFDARILWGDGALAQAWKPLQREILFASPARFAREILSLRSERVLKAGPKIGYQEPHLQDAAGGLRDAQSVAWLGRLGGGGARLAKTPLAEGAGRNATQEFAHIAHGIILAFRGALHEAAGRGEERLTLERQEEVASRLGYDAPETAMRDLLAAMTWTARLFDECAGAFSRRRASIRAPRDVWETFFASPGLLPLERRLELARAPAGRYRPAASPVDFREAWARTGLGRRIALLGENELLAHILPVWRHIEGLVRPDPVHRYAVDRHTLEAIRAVSHLMESKGRGSRWLRTALEERGRDDLLLTAILLHDAGKGRGGGHEEKGAALVESSLAPLGFENDEIEFVRFLVAEHLLLSRSAFRRDIDDPVLIDDVAGRIGSRERLASLFLLTLADLTATSAGETDEWRRSLLETLYVRLRRQLGRRLPPVEIVEATRRRRLQACRRIEPAVADADLRAHLDSFPGRYAMAFPAPAIHRHVGLIASLGPDGNLADRVRGDRPGTTEVTILTRTRRGLVSRITGVFAARGFNILEAEVMTRADGLALDAFRVEDPEGRLLEDGVWIQFTRLLDACVFGEESIDPHIERLTRYETAGVGDVEVEFIPDASPAASVLEVRAPDRIGLLYKITQEIYRCGAGLASAIVGTEEHTAIDIFYITNALGRPLDPADEERLRTSLQAGLS